MANRAGRTATHINDIPAHEEAAVDFSEEKAEFQGQKWNKDR